MSRPTYGITFGCIWAMVLYCIAQDAEATGQEELTIPRLDDPAAIPLNSGKTRENCP